MRLKFQRLSDLTLINLLYLYTFIPLYSLPKLVTAVERESFNFRA